MFNNLFNNISNNINDFANSIDNAANSANSANNSQNPLANFVNDTMNFTRNNINSNNNSKNNIPIPCKEHILFNIDIERNSTCSICLEDFNEGDIETILPCGHIFHKPCIIPWFKKDNSCPNCRITSNYGKSLLSMKLINTYYKKIKEDNLFGINTNSADLDLINRLNVKKIKFLLSEFGIDYSNCIQKSELLELIYNDIFFMNKSSKFLKIFLNKYSINSNKYLEKKNLLKVVTLIRLINRLF
jgi:hypothetical protein